MGIQAKWCSGRSALSLVVGCLLALSATLAAAQSNGIALGGATNTGTDAIHFRFSGTNERVEVLVKIINKDGTLVIEENGLAATATNKRNYVVAKLTAAGVNAEAVGTDKIKVSGGAFTSHKVETQAITPEYFKSGLGLFEGLTDYELRTPSLSLSGVDDNGDPAFYSVAFGFSGSILGDVQFASTIHFSELMQPSIDELLEALFAELSSELASSAAAGISDQLTLDNRGIRFLFPEGASTGFVFHHVTDNALVAITTLQEIAEPGSIFLLSIAMLALWPATRHRPPRRDLSGHSAVHGCRLPAKARRGREITTPCSR
ncbi:MAG: hypothetical protein KDE45_10900 [Caldilineaceae bacterium]|nr:hypothetical protein [Caldilineaceae bacterium]